MNLYLKEFFKNFLFGGTMIGLYSLIVKFISLQLQDKLQDHYQLCLLILLF